MKIDEIKQELEKHVGENAIIRYNLGRNKYEEYQVKIRKLYDYIFLVELKDCGKEMKSFSYSDIITKTIHIIY